MAVHIFPTGDHGFDLRRELVPGGGQIPFEQVADISIKSGPAQVSREDTKRRITVGFNVRGRDVQSVIKASQAVSGVLE